MKYKGYEAEIKFDNDANVFYGQILNSSAVIHFRGSSVEELNISFRESVDDYLLLCEELGASPERPFSGEFRVRISPDLHRRVFLRAKEENLSINKFAIKAFEEKLESKVDESQTEQKDENKHSVYQELLEQAKVTTVTATDSDFSTEVENLQDSTDNIITFPPIKLAS